MNADEFGRFDALGLAELVRKGEVSALELVETAIARIERVESGEQPLRAITTRAYDRARAMAAAALPPAPFAGVPFLLKDLGSAWAGVALTSGSRFHANHVPDHDGHLVQRYLQAGLIPLGRTTAPEMGLVPFTEPEAYGKVATPWRKGLTAGGSSGGSAAAVAAGVVPMAHGGDGGGSLRIPASCCGIFGFKPSRGRTPLGPDYSEAFSGFAIEHALTRSVRDSAALLDISQGPEPGALYDAPARERPYLDEVATAPGKLRIALTTKPFMPTAVHPDCIAATLDTAKLLESLGHTVVERDLDIDGQQFLSDFFAHVCVDTALQLARAAKQRKPRIGEFEVPTWMMAIRGGQIRGAELALARDRMHALARRMGTFFADFDVLLTPTLASPPVPFGALLPTGFDAIAQQIIVRAHLGFLLRVPGVPAQLEKNAATVLGFMPFTPLANVTGSPSMSLPLFWSGDDLPIGTMFTARYGDEATLFRLAAQLEESRPWAHRRPPLHADNPPVAHGERSGG